MVLSPIGVLTEEVDVVVPAPAPTSVVVLAIGSLGSSDSGDNTAIQTAIPLSTPTLLANRAAWLALNANEGSAYRAVADLYANENGPVVWIRTPEYSARGATLSPTDAELAAAVTAAETVPTVLNVTPRVVIAPNLTWARDSTSGNTGAQQEGDPVAAAGTASPLIAGLDALLDRWGAILYASAPPGADGVPNTVDNWLAWAAANRGSHERVVQVTPRQTAGGQDEDLSGAVAGARIALEAQRGVGAPSIYAPVVTSGGVPRPPLSNSFGQDTTDDAARLSAAGVMAVIRHQGLHLWGNTVGVASASSPYRFINVRRVADEIERQMRLINIPALRFGVGEDYFDAVEFGSNQYLRELEAEGSIASGNVTRNDERNTAAAAAAGRTFFRVTFEPVYGVRTAEFEIELEA